MKKLAFVFIFLPLVAWGIPDQTREITELRAENTQLKQTLGQIQALITPLLERNFEVFTEKSCVVINGQGQKNWNEDTEKWGRCKVTSCKSGYEFRGKVGIGKCYKTCVKGTRRKWLNTRWGVCR